MRAHICCRACSRSLSRTGVSGVGAGTSGKGLRASLSCLRYHRKHCERQRWRVAVRATSAPGQNESWLARTSTLASPWPLPAGMT